jgi:hypothetical protein
MIQDLEHVMPEIANSRISTVAEMWGSECPRSSLAAFHHAIMNDGRFMSLSQTQCYSTVEQHCMNHMAGNHRSGTLAEPKQSVPAWRHKKTLGNITHSHVCKTCEVYVMLQQL